MWGRTSACSAADRAGRWAIAQQFDDAAEMVSQLGDDDTALGNACVTLWVHAGIAASDVLCCARLGQHSRGQDHQEAVALLLQADAPSAPHLRRLLALKTQAGCSPRTLRRSDVLAAQRACQALMDAARAV